MLRWRSSFAMFSPILLILIAVVAGQNYPGRKLVSSTYSSSTSTSTSDLNPNEVLYDPLETDRTTDIKSNANADKDGVEAETEENEEIGMTSKEAETAFIIMGCFLVISLAVVSIYFMTKKSPQSYPLRTQISFASSDPTMQRVAKPSFMEALKNLDTESQGTESTLDDDDVERNRSRMIRNGANDPPVIKFKTNDYPLLVQA